MATHTYKRCPHCGKVYETYSTYTKQLKDHSGSPFVICKFCGKRFVDREIREPALSPPSSNEVTIVNCFFAAFVPLAGPGIFLTCAAYNSDPSSIGLWLFGAIFDLLYVASVIYFLRKRKVVNAIAKKEYQKSYDRLKDPEYARALADAGFDVPNEFIQTYPAELEQMFEKSNEEIAKIRTESMQEAMQRDHNLRCRKCGKKLNALQVVCDNCGERKF